MKKDTGKRQTTKGTREQRNGVGRTAEEQEAYDAQCRLDHAERAAQPLDVDSDEHVDLMSALLEAAKELRQKAIKLRDGVDCSGNTGAGPDDDSEAFGRAHGLETMADALVRQHERMSWRVRLDRGMANVRKLASGKALRRER